MKHIGMEATQDVYDYIQKTLYPDFRKLMQVLQRLSAKGKTDITIDDIKSGNYEFKELYELIVSEKDPVKIHQAVVNDYSGKIIEVMQDLGDNFVNWIINERAMVARAIPSIIIKVAEYQSKRSLVIDPLVSLKALIFELSLLTK
jgi:hypothetical protein